MTTTTTTTPTPTTKPQSIVEQQQEQPAEENHAACGQKKSTKKPNEESKNGPSGIIILGVYIHCEGCANEVLSCLRGFEGVEGIEIDAKNGKVVVKGQKADPIKVTERLRRRTGKHVQLISPKQPKKQVNEDKPKPEPEPKVIESVLKIYMHCEGCVKDVKHCIHQMEGVQTVEPEMTKNLVTVKGSMDPQKLVEFIHKRGGWNATVVKQSNIAKTNPKQKSIDVAKEKKKDEDVVVERDNRKDDHKNSYIYPREPVYAPQLFSDENPNSCFIM